MSHILRFSKIANTKLELFPKVANLAKDPTIGIGPSSARGHEKSKGPGPRGHEYEMTGRISDVSIAVKRRACVPRRGFRDVVGDIGHRGRPLSQGSPKGEAGRANPGWHARGGRQRPVGPRTKLITEFQVFLFRGEELSTRATWACLLSLTGPRTMSHPRDPWLRKRMLYPPADLRHR